MKVSGYALVLLSVSNVSQGMGFSIHTLASRSEKAVASELRDGPASIPETSPCSTDTVRLHASMPMNTFEDGRLPDGESFLVGAASGPLSPDCCNKPLTPSVDRLDWDWKTLARSVFTPDEQRPIVLFDGVCTLCDATINFVMDHDRGAQLRFCSLQSRTAQALLVQAGQSPEDTNRIVLVTPSQTYFAGEAVCHICQKLDPLPLQMLGMLGLWTPRDLREPLYHFVSKRRHVFGENQSCRFDFDGTLGTRFISDPSDIAQV
jgi:predicted DCC family thiol-disulfide oxidoreductase YuxK